jgi:dipeptidyl aminopeptidase/acylaminoacyl peptidase
MAATDLSSKIYLLDLGQPLADRLVETLPVPGYAALWLSDWSPDGSRLSIVGRDRDGSDASYVYALASRTLTKVSDCGGGGHWLRDSRRLLVACGNRLVLLDGATGSSRELLAISDSASTGTLAAAISRDERRIAYATRSLDGDLWAMTLP